MDGITHMTDRFSGDPRIIIEPNGARFDWRDGQPTMDQGLENLCNISLFTDAGWCGNTFLAPDSQIGSDFEALCHTGGITLSRLADIEDAATRALKTPALGMIKATVTNPTSDQIRLVTSTGPGSLSLEATRAGGLWKSQATDPAYRRIK